MKKSVTGGVAKEINDKQTQKKKVVRKKLSSRKVIFEPADESTLCAYDKIRLDSIKEREEIMIKLGFLEVKEKKVKKKRVTKLKSDEVTVLRRSARLCIIADL